MRSMDALTFALRSAALPVAAIAVLNSALLMAQHARDNRHPALRVYTMRILFMVIVDSVVAVCGLWGTGWQPALDPYVNHVLRFVVELYESLVIFSFLQFVLVCAGGLEHLISRFKRRGMEAETADALGKRRLTHVPPLNRLLPPWASGKEMLRCCTSGTLGYVVFGATLAPVGIILLSVPGSKDAKASVWEVGAVGLSLAQGTAILSLAELAVNVREELAPFRPYGKFLSVKFVVFFSFWQGLVLQGLFKWGLFNAFAGAQCNARCARDVVQNTLICLEMLGASIIHFHVFPPHDYLTLLAQHLDGGLAGSADGMAVCHQPSNRSGVAEFLDIRDIFRITQQVRRYRTPSCSSNSIRPSWGSGGGSTWPTGQPEPASPQVAAHEAQGTDTLALASAEGSPSSYSYAQDDPDEAVVADGGSHPAGSTRGRVTFAADSTDSRSEGSPSSFSYAPGDLEAGGTNDVVEGGGGSHPAEWARPALSVQSLGPRPADGPLQLPSPPQPQSDPEEEGDFGAAVPPTQGRAVPPNPPS